MSPFPLPVSSGWFNEFVDGLEAITYKVEDIAEFVWDDLTSGRAKDRIDPFVDITIDILDPREDINNTIECIKGTGSCVATAIDIAARKADKLVDMFKELKKIFNNNPCNCLVAGTQVLTQEGLKDIEDIEIGDMVWASDPITGESGWKPVTSLFTNIPKPIYVIELDVEGEILIIESTDDHPFYVIDTGWVKTINLQQGYQVETKEGLFVTVISVELTAQQEVTYNFKQKYRTPKILFDGNLIQDGDKTLSYDALDRLIKVEENGQTLASFTYDALSRRVSKTNTTETTIYYHDGYQVIEEHNQQGLFLRNYIQGRHLDE
ncbi:MAG: hypothetical protein L3J83_10035, partial [Proteobacteria bacterium]|nr:hypothetical protein [Pseudomonadota bacterium]